MNIIKAFQKLQQAHIYQRRIKRAAIQLAKQLDWQFDPAAPPEELAIELLAHVSMTIAVASHAPIINKPSKLDDLDLAKHPIKPQSQPLLTPEYLAINSNDLN